MRGLRGLGLGVEPYRGRGLERAGNQRGLPWRRQGAVLTKAQRGAGSFELEGAEPQLAEVAIIARQFNSFAHYLFRSGRLTTGN
jgi:hypothetical protein